MPAPPPLGGPGPGKGAEPVGPAAPGPTVPTALGVWAAGTLGRGHGRARVCARPGGWAGGGTGSAPRRGSLVSAVTAVCRVTEARAAI